MHGAHGCSVIWEWFDFVGPEEVGRILRAVSWATCSLDLCLFWLAKTAWGVRSGWVLAVVNSSLREGAIPLPLKEAFGHPPLLKKPLLGPSSIFRGDCGDEGAEFFFDAGGGQIGCSLSAAQSEPLFCLQRKRWPKRH